MFAMEKLQYILREHKLSRMRYGLLDLTLPLSSSSPSLPLNALVHSIQVTENYKCVATPCMSSIALLCLILAYQILVSSLNNLPPILVAQSCFLPPFDVPPQPPSICPFILTSCPSPPPNSCASILTLVYQIPIPCIRLQI